jgi:hypothetical protein
VQAARTGSQQAVARRLITDELQAGMVACALSGLISPQPSHRASGGRGQSAFPRPSAAAGAERVPSAFCIAGAVPSRTDDAGPGSPSATLSVLLFSLNYARSAPSLFFAS